MSIVRILRVPKVPIRNNDRLSTCEFDGINYCTFLLVSAILRTCDKKMWRTLAIIELLQYTPNHDHVCFACIRLAGLHESPIWGQRPLRRMLDFGWNCKKTGLYELNKKSKFLEGPVNPNSCSRHSVRMILNFKKTSKTAVVLIAGVTISGTPCPRHFTVPLSAEAPSDHVVQAWAIQPPSWGLLSQWHRQETTMPETNEASSARTQRHS